MGPTEQLISIVGLGLTTSLSINFLIITHLLGTYARKDLGKTERGKYAYSIIIMIFVLWFGIFGLASLGSFILSYICTAIPAIVFFTLQTLGLAGGITVVAVKSLRGNTNTM